MSSDLSYIRRQLSGVRSLVAQEKVASAMRAVREAFLATRRQELLRKEKEELELLITDALHFINMSKAVKESGFGILTHKQGNEKKTLAQLNLFISAFENELQENAETAYAEVFLKRQEFLKLAKDKLEQDDTDGALKIFSSLSKKFPNDSGLQAEIAASLFLVMNYEESAKYFEKAISLNSDSTSLYNDYAIVLRKQKKFSEAEDAYKKAIALDEENPHLFFNLGRVYLDWELWAYAMEAAKNAMDLDPKFTEATKLYTYAKRKDEGKK